MTPLPVALLAACAAGAVSAVPEVALKARSFQPGEAVLIVATDQKPGAPPTGRFGGDELRFFPASAPSAYLALAAIDLEQKPGKIPVTVELIGGDGTPRRWSQEVDVKPKKFPVRRLNVPARYVKPNPQEEARAEADAKQVGAVYRQVTAERLFDGSFASPIPGAVSSHFGTRSVFNGVPKAPHAGADLHAAEGTPVKACAGARVAFAADLFYSGNTVILDHGYGIHSLYAHLSRIDVKPGDRVKPGDVIGLVGMTGRVTGPHLHWGVKIGTSGRVDPFALTSFDLDAYLK